MRFAQIDSDNEIVQFVGFNTNANAVAMCQANPDCLFVPTEYFGAPARYRYDPETGEVTPRPAEQD